MVQGFQAYAPQPALAGGAALSPYAENHADALKGVWYIYIHISTKLITILSVRIYIYTYTCDIHTSYHIICMQFAGHLRDHF